MRKTLLLFLLAVISISPACKKNKQTDADPCKDLYAALEPAHVALIFIDKETGENILLSKNIDPAKVTVTPETNVRIIKDTSSNLNGALRFYIADTKKGDYKYVVNIPDVGTATLTYTNEEVETGNVCHPVAIVVNSPSIGEYSYTTVKSGTGFIITIKI